MVDTTPKGSQFNQPLLEFSGSCAGCAETSYARLITPVSYTHLDVYKRQMRVRALRGFMCLTDRYFAYQIRKDLKYLT